MCRYIIDANLPYYFSLWKDDNYEHVIDIDPNMKDSEIRLGEVYLFQLKKDFQEPISFI